MGEGVTGLKPGDKVIPCYTPQCGEPVPWSCWFGDVFFFLGWRWGGGCFFLPFFSVSLWEDECWQVDVGVIVMQGSRLEIMRFPKFCVVKHPDLYIYL